jgi:hypothetical protein
VAYAAEFALEADALGVVGGGVGRVPWRSALGRCVVVIVLYVPLANKQEGLLKTGSYVIIAGTMIVPPSDRIDKARRVQGPNHIGKTKLDGIPPPLAPTFVVDDLYGRVSLWSLMPCINLPMLRCWDSSCVAQLE